MGDEGLQSHQVLRKCYIRRMRTISQRELRNDNAKVMREVAQGASIRVTSRGVPVAVIRPITEQPHQVLAELVVREGSGAMEFPTGVHVARPTADALAELRGDR